MPQLRSDISGLTVPRLPALAEALRESRNRIEFEIAAALRAIPGSAYPDQDDEVLRIWAHEGVEAMAAALDVGSTEPLENYAEDVARRRLELGFQLHHVVHGIVLHRDETLPVVLDASREPGQTIEWIGAVNTCSRFTLSHFIEVFAEEVRESERNVAIVNERQRLARELHDSVTQSLYGVTLHAEVAARHLASGETSKAVDSLDCVRETSVDALREMRLLLFELSPPDLSAKGLVQVLSERLAAVEGRTGIRTRFEVSGVDRLPSEVERGLLGIAREALHNAWKHAQPTSIGITLSRVGPIVSLEVRDDGVGFDLTKQRAGEGLGLGTMNERARGLGGHLVIETRLDLGTVVRVELPVDPELESGSRIRPHK